MVENGTENALFMIPICLQLLLLLLLSTTFMFSFPFLFKVEPVLFLLHLHRLAWHFLSPYDFLWQRAPLYAKTRWCKFLRPSTIRWCPWCSCSRCRSARGNLTLRESDFTVKFAVDFEVIEHLIFVLPFNWSQGFFVFRSQRVMQ